MPNQPFDQPCAGKDGEAPRTDGWRVRTLIAAVLFGWMALAARLVFVQAIGASDFAEAAARQRMYSETIPARPGEIVDRNGRLLAATIDVESLYVVPSRIEDAASLAARLATALQLDAEEVTERIESHRDKHFVWIKRRLTPGEADRVRKLELPREQWGFREEHMRKYPQGSLAVHVIGLRDIDGNGRGGVEQAYDRILRGRDGRRLLGRDAMGRVIEVQCRIDEAPRHGRTVVLALDSVVQLHAERELDQVMSEWQPKNACALVIEPKTGDVLAMASRPAFDPNRPIDVPDAAWKNTAVASIFEPGSTLKPLVVAWAIDKEFIDPNEEFDCEQGSYRMGGRVLHDVHAYGRLSIGEILVKSSNIGMAKIGERLANDELHRAVTSFGLGRRTGCGLPGEVAGMVRPLAEWNSYSTGSVPMGHEIAVTPLQLISAHAALANGGMHIVPRIVRRHTDRIPSLSGGRADEEQSAAIVSKILLPESARWTVQGPMVDVIQRGTGTRARLDGYRVFGKTGTAQKVDPQTGKYSETAHTTSFICGAPADDPRVLVLVVVDEPSVGISHFGGTVAAPAAAAILEKTLYHLGIPPNTKPMAATPRQRD